nr:unnamed protein product [Digitaria exilis]
MPGKHCVSAGQAVSQHHCSAKATAASARGSSVRRNSIRVRKATAAVLHPVATICVRVAEEPPALSWI